MVLEEAINESDGGGSNTFPSDASTPISDVDPWSSANNGPAADSNVKIDASTLPRPIPIFGGLFGFTQSALEQAISGTVNAMAQRVRRPLREEECQAIAYHTAKGAAISSYGAPIGIAAGIWRARRTRESYRFPFFKPDLKTFDPYKLGPLTGTRAQRGWHILRMVTYATVGGSLGRFLIRSYAVTVAVAGWRLDPRLKDVVETLGKIGREAAEARQRGDSVDDSRASTAQQRQHHQQQQNEKSQQVNFKASGDGSRQSRQDFDASPTAYPWSDGEASSASTYGDDSRQESNIRETRSETRQSYQQQARPKQDSQRPPGRADGGAGADFDFGNYDNASPTASPSYSNESAWDRIRRGGPASGGNRSAASQAQSRADSEGVGYNAWDRARAQGDHQQQQQSNQQQQQQKEQYQSKEEAQRAFDAQLERERQGKNF